MKAKITLHDGTSKHLASGIPWQITSLTDLQQTAKSTLWSTAKLWRAVHKRTTYVQQDFGKK